MRSGIMIIAHQPKDKKFTKINQGGLYGALGVKWTVSDETLKELKKKGVKIKK